MYTLISFGFCLRIFNFRYNNPCFKLTNFEICIASIKQLLTQLKPELQKKYKVSSLGIFGSAVRKDFSDQSDIDIIVDFSQPIGVEFIDLANLLEIKLNTAVDLVSKKGIKKEYFSEIASEIIYV